MKNTELNRLKMKSVNLVVENIKKIATIFPNCVTEGKVDFDLLRQELSGSLVEGKDERYRLDWSGKRQAILTANSPIAKTLRPVREESVNFDTTENLYIEGDNLDVLKLLHETYLGKVKMIYIDPPYNTGNDFVYNDDFAENTEEYLERSNQKDDQGNRLETNKETNGRFHSDWLSMMYMRLKLAKDLLTYDGVIFISIDDNEHVNLKRICDEIYGEQNFVASIAWQNLDTIKNDAKYFSDNHEYILVYAKQIESTVIQGIKKGEKQRKYYRNPDNDQRGDYLLTPLHAKSGTEAGIYTYTFSNGQTWTPPQGTFPRFSQKTLRQLEEDNRLYLDPRGINTPQKKTYFNEVGDRMPPVTFWDYSSFGSTRQSNMELANLVGKGIFQNSKPTKTIATLIDLVADTQESIVLDFFSGSGTTAHAVMQLNAEDGGRRKFVMVQMREVCSESSEATKNGYSTICEIGKERIRRAGKKIVDDSKSTVTNLDIGFRVLKLADSNMRDVFYNPKQYDQTMLSSLYSLIKDDRTDEDILFQIMLEKGVLLSSKIEKRTTTNGKQTYYIVGNTRLGNIDLICCLDKKVNTEAVKEIAKLSAECVVFLDSGIEDDATLTNIEQIFKSYSPNTKVEVL